MKYIRFYFDFLSPYAYLAFEQLPQALGGLSYSVRYMPVLFAAMLKQHGQLGPAEIAPKRDWTYRQVLWLAHSQGIPLQLPASHPFNPLPLLRLALACAPEAEPGAPSRYVCESIFRHVWRGGAEAADVQRFESLVQQLAPQQAPQNMPDVQGRMQGEAVKAQLKKNTEEAMTQGAFGVPAFAVDDKLFWGLDSLPMLRAYLLDDPWFSGPDWNGVSQVISGMTRRR
ncbi:2-hydroxychromene-2-carboxylate isomerase [Polaromonas jejuensis]|uniref:2-hydroxychromene-2-carboxylate isomerase n=1 Tax=Polaromonas jejuensis TaxID=457502 RepID=A0ABW0QC63_9BURK|nr:2-hydroxychromene-2-carboxylate isomerase [Polaromonas jejuensis]